MKIVIDIPRGGVWRLLVFVGLPMAVVMAAAMMARAYDTSWIGAGKTVSSSQLQADLTAIQTDVSNLQAAIAVLQAKTTYVAQATNTTTTKSIGTFVDIPGASLGFTTATNASVDLMAGGELFASNAGGGGYDGGCALRFVVDATAAGNPTSGDGFVEGVMNASGYVSNPAVITISLSNLPAGHHTVSLQLSVLNESHPPPGGTSCSTFGEDSSASVMTLFATVR